MSNFNEIFRRLGRSSFVQDERGNVAMIFGVSILPIMFFIGTSIDYGRANQAGAVLQNSIDIATINGAAASTTTRQSVAQAAYAANAAKVKATSTSATFNATSTTYTGTATATIPTTFMHVAGVSSITLNRSSTVKFGAAELPCIQTLGGSRASTEEILTFNGSPNVNLTGCSLRSNKSMKCNGNTTVASAFKATGTVQGCSGGVGGQAPLADSFDALKSNISKSCSTSLTAAIPTTTWSAGTYVPAGSNVTSTPRTGYSEYHVCGNLVLSGSGTITGAAPTSDIVVYVENGDLTLADNAVISAKRITFILTGTASVSVTTTEVKGNKIETETENVTTSHKVVFPNGNGHAATFTISPSTSTGNPWKGVSIYQDPALTSNVNLNWGSGANLVADGVLYFPKAQLTVGGAMSSGLGGCTKIISETYTSNGGVNLTMSASASACDALQVAYTSNAPYLSN